MFPIREADAGEEQYQQHLALIRQRILAYVQRRLVPREADFAEAEEIAQNAIVVLWERYPGKRQLSEMMGIAIGTARHKIAQFRRDRERVSRAAADGLSASDSSLFEHVAARESADRFLRAMLQLPPRCRELLRLKLVEQQEYAEIRLRMGISGNIYQMVKRCHQAMLRLVGGGR
ncbi:MAG TPA: sigma-70 family RNA polymerase sigma factor [Bryobacteraceae bacterium]|nr:sigma-70 family RNA polymerase sigma factor [Bryobacteraceae bacterium]